MGVGIGENSKQPIGEIKKPFKTGKSGNTGDASTADRNTSSLNTERTGDGGTGDGRTGNTAGQAEKENPVVVPVLDNSKTDEKKKLDEKNARRRELYAKKKEENGGSYKPRKTRQTKKENPVNDESLKIFINTIFGLVASRPGCEHWLLSEEEVKKLSEPLAKILANSQAFAGLGEHSNEVALVMACLTIFVPRLTISHNKKQEEKKKNDRKSDIRTISGQDTGLQSPVGDTGKKKIENKGINNGDNRQLAGHGENAYKNEPFLGFALN